MSGFVITPQMLQKASQDTMNVRENSMANISQLRNQLSGLEGAWKGQAAMAFHSLVQRFNTASDKILADLQTISESLNTAAKQYGAQEEAAQQSFKSQEGGFAF